MKVLNLEPSEICEIQQLLAGITEKYKHAADEAFLDHAANYAMELPKRIRGFYQSLKYDDLDPGITILRGFPCDDITNTPIGWDYKASYYPNFNIDYLSVVLSTIVGDPFAWSTQQNGKVIHDIIPMPGKEYQQLSTGSKSALLLHTEDAFNDYRGDYLCFYCLRNPSDVLSIFSSIRNVEFSEATQKVLMADRFLINPDDSHLESEQRLDDVKDEYIDEMCDQNKRFSLLYGNVKAPYLRYDPAYTAIIENDEEAKAAFELMQKKVEEQIQTTVLNAGDICIVDNRKVAHGRGSFKPVYDGNDRWLKRINITSNLRLSAQLRTCENNRLIGA